MKTVDHTELYRYKTPQLARAAIVAAVWGLFYVILLVSGFSGSRPTRHETVASIGSAAQNHAAVGSALADPTDGASAAP